MEKFAKKSSEDRRHGRLRRAGNDISSTEKPAKKRELRICRKKTGDKKKHLKRPDKA